MGHERLGVLPRSIRWRAVVGQISEADVSVEASTQLAELTLKNVRKQYLGLAETEGVYDAIRFLLALPISTRTGQPAKALRDDFGIELDDPPLPLALARAFQKSLRGFARTEHEDLASKALGDALAKFASLPRFGQTSFLAPSPWDTWRDADSAAGFCELSRLYFANLTERYLRYFLDREASAVLGDPGRVTAFRSQLGGAIDSVSRHAFETSKITQSFAAGWFQKSAKGGMPSRRDIRAFLSFALHKIREELRREVEAL
jgi:hypothetical protein